MIELTNVPEVLYNASHDDEFLVRGEQFRFEVVEGGEKVFLTKLPEDSPWEHVRDERDVALFTRKELVELLTYNLFAIY